MKGSITPAFSKAGIPGLDFVAGGAGPVPLIFGYYYDDSESNPAITGAFSPQQIIKPSKDVVDVKVYLWWLGVVYHTGELPSPNEKVGWLMMLNQVRSDHWKDISYLAGGGALSDLTVESTASNGDISWGAFGLAGYPGFPYTQLCVAYDACAEDDDVPSGDTRPALYRVPMKYVKKVGGKFVADDAVSFKQFSATLSSYPVGEILTLYRTRGGGDGLFVDPWIDYDGDGTNETDNYSDDGYTPLFLGIEVEVI